MTFLNHQRNYFLSEICYNELLLADEVRHLNFSSEKNLESLLLSDLLTFPQEVFHAACIVDLKEIFEAFLDPELLICVSEQANVYDGEQILGLLGVGAAHDNDKVLLGLGSQLQGDSLSQLLRNRVLNVPCLMLDLTVNNGISCLLAVLFLCVQ